MRMLSDTNSIKVKLGQEWPHFGIAFYCVILICIFTIIASKEMAICIIIIEGCE